MKTATKVGQERVSPAGATQQVYRMDPPHEGHEYVLASAVVPLMGLLGDGPETYLFPCDAEGHVSEWLELAGSRKGTFSHVDVLTELGYKVCEPAKEAG